MSYPYDINPWDDNYNLNSSQQQTTNYGYENSYNNYQYSATPNQPYQYEETQQQVQQGDQSNVETQDESSNRQQEESAFRKFLRQRIPICGPIMDTMSAINLPFIDKLVQHINRDLLISKMFYFFFYSAFGSLFPLMGVYFKQLGMNPAQVGILTGVRPFIEIFSAPFWNSLAERFHKSKALLLFSLLSWIVFTYSLAHIRPPASACVAYNNTHYVLYTPYSANDLSNYELDQEDDSINSKSKGNEMFMDRMPEASKDLKSKEKTIELGQRKKRKKRQLESQVNSPSSQTLDRLHYSGFDVDQDLDADFDDTFVQQSKGYGRVRRNLKDSDYPIGENDDSEPDADINMEKEKEKGKSGKLKSAGGQSEDQEESDEDESVENGTNRFKTKGDSDGSSAGKSPQIDETGEPKTLDENSHEQSSERKFSGASGQSEGENANELSVSLMNRTKRVYKQRHKTPPTHIVGMSPITVEYAVNYNKDKHSQFVTPMFSTIVYKLDDIKEVFFLLLLLISLGEFFSAPALTLADSATLSYLGDNTDLYGRQRMFGSLSWAITLLLVGMALDNSTSIADHPCGPHQRERSYTVCYAIFSLLMSCAFLTATQFRFNYPKATDNSANSNGQALIAKATDNNRVVTTTLNDSNGAENIDQIYASTQPRSIFNTAPPVNEAAAIGSTLNGKEKFEFLDQWRSAVFAQRTWEVPEWVNVFRQFKNSLHLTYLFITWFLGCGVGLVFTFLFWHLQDVGGTPTLFGICSVINHISEILAYFFSFNFIKRFGHTRVLSVGLGCNVIRFIYVAFLTNPYYALPFEFVQGITHAACFAACCSYISHVSKPELRTSTQGVMQGLHHGIGRACGALMGGYMINAIGSRASFCLYGLLSGCVLGGFLYVRKRASETEMVEEEEFKVEENEALGGFGAPQGVPTTIPGKLAGHQ